MQGASAEIQYDRKEKFKTAKNSVAIVTILFLLSEQNPIYIIQDQMSISCCSTIIVTGIICLNL